MSNLTLWSPRRSPALADLDTVFDDLTRFAFAPAVTRGFTPAAEVLRDGDDAVVRLELPGVDVSKDVTVEIDGRRLTVRGERRDERSSERDGRALREVRYGSFRRSFTLPRGVSAEAVSAGYDAGVLSVRVGGAYATAPAHRVEITTAAPATAERTAEERGEQSAETGGEPAAQA